MASSLFRDDATGPARAASEAMRRQGPDAVFSALMSSNPMFRQFIEQNQGKSPEQIARENGIDFSALKSRFG